MSDRRLRELERQAAAGDPEALERLRRLRCGMDKHEPRMSVSPLASWRWTGWTDCLWCDARQPLPIVLILSPEEHWREVARLYYQEYRSHLLEGLRSGDADARWFPGWPPPSDYSRHIWAREWPATLQPLEPRHTIRLEDTQ